MVAKNNLPGAPLRTWSSDQLLNVDAWEFCRHAGVAHGGPTAGNAGSLVKGIVFERLLTELTSSPTDLSWSIEGRTDREGRCDLRFSGVFTAQRECQRCGQKVSEHLAFERTLRLCKSEKEADSADDGSDESIDFVAAPGKVNVLEWLEDEMLLSLPMFVTHNDCTESPALKEYQARLVHSSSVDEQASPDDQLRPSNPFAVLASLKKPRE